MIPKIAKRDALRLLACILVCEAAGIVGSVFTAPAIPAWYATISKPAFNPPNWLFAPVWTALFALMGVALYLVWKTGLGKKQTRIAVALFGVQLALNIAWSFLFFGINALGAAFAEILLLWAFILVNIITFYRIERKAGLALVPYILWVSFAAFLNYAVWMLNI